MTLHKDQPALPHLPEALSNEIARELWCSRYLAENPYLTPQDVQVIWRSDVDRVREMRKAIRLGLMRLAQRGIVAAEDATTPLSKDTTHEIARELWIAERWNEDAALQYKQVEAFWADDTERVRKTREISGLVLARLRARGIGFITPQ